jgi:hypothetical protein
MNKMILILLFMLITNVGFTQERKLKDNQPTMIELMMVVIPINPYDTVLQPSNFSHLPIKGFPFFTADPSIPFYTIAQRDSIIRKVDGMFFEEEIE